MANGNFERYIREAMERIADKGYADADLKDVIMGMGGYISDKVDEKTVTLKLSGKLMTSVGVLLGGGVGSLITTLFGG